MADTVPGHVLVTMALRDGEQVPQTVILSDGTHYTRDTDHDCVHVWDFHVPEMRGKGYRDMSDEEAERHRARRERSLPGVHYDALRVVRDTVPAEDVAVTTPTAGSDVVQDAQKAQAKADREQAKK